MELGQNMTREVGSNPRFIPPLLLTILLEHLQTTI